MTNKKTGRSAASKNTPANKTPAKKTAPAAKEEVKLVAPLDQGAFKSLLQIIDNSDIKGGDAQNILKIKAELARVAGLTK